MLISSAEYIDQKTKWKITIVDLGPKGRIHDNPNKLNFLKNSRTCHFTDCNNSIRVNSRSGLCELHKKHQHTLFLELHNTNGEKVNAPLHVEIVDKLIDWSKPRNYDLIPLFTALSFNILGNIPDVSTIAGDTKHVRFAPMSLQEYLDEVVGLVDMYLPDFNNSSYQTLKTKKSGDIPARILAIAFAGLILCEEANRGDRWFCRTIQKNEAETELLGGAMPIGYFAACNFPWGIQIGKAARRFVPN